MHLKKPLNSLWASHIMYNQYDFATENILGRVLRVLSSTQCFICTVFTIKVLSCSASHFNFGKKTNKTKLSDQRNTRTAYIYFFILQRYSEQKLSLLSKSAILFCRVGANSSLLSVQRNVSMPTGCYHQCPYLPLAAAPTKRKQSTHPDSQGFMAHCCSCVTVIKGST